MQQQATDDEQLSDSTILEEGEGLGRGGRIDGTLAEDDTKIVFETPAEFPSGGGRISSSSQACQDPKISPISTGTTTVGGGGGGSSSSSMGRLVLAGSSAVAGRGRGRGQGWGNRGQAIGFAGGRGGRGMGGWPGGMAMQKKRDALTEKWR